MIEIGRTVTNGIFVFAVVFIWLMLLYQFVLTIGGFLCKRKTLKEEAIEVADSLLPSVSILIPAKNEEKVIGSLLERIREFDYPPEKIEVVVINDGSTDSTEKIISAIGARDDRIKLFNIPIAEGGKGKSAALNKALKRTVNDAIVIYDADNVPEKDSLRKLCKSLVLDKRLAAVTGKFRAYNKGRNLLTRLINIEGIVFQWIIQAGRWHFFKISAIPGTNFVIWKRVLEELGGWDPQALTEDSELTFRIYEKGYLIKFMPNATTWEQEPENLKVWLRQRTRWAQGNNYIIAKYGKKIFKSKPRMTLVELLNMLYLYYFFVFAILFSDILFILSLFGLVHIQVLGPYAELWGLAFLLYVLEILIALSYEKEDTLSSIYYILMAYLTYTKLWIWVVLRGFYQEYIRKGERTWAKTERFEVTGKDMSETVKPE
jgi:cellulose synthase/poly-beta-1,6-N-acetylglucosamine synthase-like glycosyltransferase